MWENEVGGLAYEVGDGPPRFFVKWAPAGTMIDLAAEAARMRWAVDYVAVPRVLDAGETIEGAWLATSALSGDNAIAARWTAAPARTVAALGEGLRAFHDALPVDACPFTWTVEDRVGVVQGLHASGALDRAEWRKEDHDQLDIDAALALLAEPPPIDRLVVCHGDTCAPNMILTDDGRCSGYVDLGALGVADRWADLAIATLSTTWNYGPGWERPLPLTRTRPPEDLLPHLRRARDLVDRRFGLVLVPISGARRRGTHWVRGPMVGSNAQRCLCVALNTHAQQRSGRCGVPSSAQSHTEHERVKPVGLDPDACRGPRAAHAREVRQEPE